MKLVLEDIILGLSRWQLWSMLAWEDFKARYHRTLLGPIWVTVSFLLFVGVKIFIFGALNHGDFEYFAPFVTLGFMVWTYIGSVMNGGATAFVGSRGWILGIKTPLSIFILENIFGSLINFLFIAVAAIAITLYYKPFTILEALQSVLGMSLLVFSLFWVQLFLATLCVFLRDFVQLISTAMRLAFFMTPIIWIPSALGTRAFVADYNPFTHYLNIVRGPLIDGSVPTLSYMVVGSVTVVAIVASLSLMSLVYRKIPAHV